VKDGRAITLLYETHARVMVWLGLFDRGIAARVNRFCGSMCHLRTTWPAGAKMSKGLPKRGKQNRHGH